MTRVTSLRYFVGDCVGTELQVACSNHLEPLVRWSEFAATGRALVSVVSRYEFFLAAEEIVVIEPVPTAARVVRGDDWHWDIPLVASPSHGFWSKDHPSRRIIYCHERGVRDGSDRCRHGHSLDGFW